MIFPCMTFTSVTDILRMDFDYFILDMGVLNVYSAKEFAKCEKQFLVCSLSKWKRKQTFEKLLQLLNNTYISQEYITILGNCDKKESTLSLSLSVRFRMISVPFITNPFQLHSEFFTFFEKILGQY